MGVTRVSVRRRCVAAVRQDVSLDQVSRNR
jgi:hypothetical protein